MNGNKKKVFVGMSGGVDSSVSAAILKRDGFDVTGVFIRVWEPDWMGPASTRGGCTSKEDRLDAMRVAAHLDIPFLTIDFSSEYKKEVVDYMISEYEKGKTPNPDVMCNRHVKFGAFFDWAMNHGAEFIATGHYARVVQNSKLKVQNLNSKAEKSKLGTIDYKLLAGVDSTKDQSYFLWTLAQRELSKTLFPVGGMEKNDVRKLAKKFKLPNATKKDSQGLCFIGKVDMKEFLSHYIEEKSGQVLDESGQVIGKHNGAVFFTIGERHGFDVTNKTPSDKPYYIVAKDVIKNSITVSHKSLSGNLPNEKKDFVLTNTNWISNKPELGKAYTARVRHLGALFPCSFKDVSSNKASLDFEKPLSVAPGQSIVVYDRETCLGGGIVK